MKKTFLKIITPEGLFYNGEVEIVTVKTTEGNIGLMHGKSPFVASLDIAELQINKHGSKDFLDCAIAGGLVYAKADSVNIITDAIEEKSKIDITRAEKARKIAEQELKIKMDAKEHLLADQALKRAINRINVKRG